MIKKNIINTFFYNFFNLITKLIAFPIIVKSLSVEDFGLYGMLGTIISMSTLIGSMELYNYLRRELPGKSTEVQISYYKSIHLTQSLIFIGFIIIMITMDLQKTISLSLIDYSINNIVVLSLLLIIPNIIISDIVRYFVSIKNISTANFINFLSQQSYTFILIILYFFGYHISLGLWIKTHLLTSSLCVIIGLSKIGFWNILKANYQFKLYKNALFFGSVILVTVAMSELLIFASRFFIIKLIDITALAYFFFILKLPDMANTFSTNIINYSTRPQLIEYINLGQKKNQILIGTKMMIVNILLYFIIIIPIIFNIEQIIMFFGKKEYSHLNNLIIILLVGGFINVFTFPFFTDIYAKGNKGALFKISFFSNIVSLFIMVTFIYFFGLIGSVIGLLSGYVVRLVFSIKYSETKIIYLHKKQMYLLLIYFASSIISVLILDNLFNQFFTDDFQLIMIIITSLIYSLVPALFLIIYKIIKIRFENYRLKIFWNLQSKSQ